jgi:hypothetical protein
MKKAFFALITVFLSLALFSCFFTAPDTPEPRADGMVELTIGTTAPRALTLALAKAGVNYYEVVFSDGSKYYRTAWHAAQGNGKLVVPAGIYDTATTAILFAGTYYENDRMLLAAGRMTDPNDGEITTAMSSVTFTLYALTSDVTDNGGTSSFKITGPAGPPSWATPTAIPTLPVGTGTESFDYPVFEVKLGDTVTATFTIGGLTNTGAGIVINSSDNKLGSEGLLLGSFPNNSTGLALKDVAYTPASGAPLGAGGVISMDIEGAATTAIADPFVRGYGLLFIEFPVSAIADDVPGRLVWYIRGGLNNRSLDAGATTLSKGGAILVCTVPTPEALLQIVTPPTWPGP